MTTIGLRHYYDHPVLWNDNRRRLEENKISNEHLQVKNQLVKLKQLAKNRDVREFREMLRHNPWGKPGGGAPNSSVRLRNITLEGLHPEQKLKPRIPLPNFTMRIPKNAGGGGAPIRSASGRLLTHLREDPMISFNTANKRHVDNLLRYKTSPNAQQTYKHQLDRIVAERAKLARIRELPDEEFDDRQFNDAFGKKGPGGLPWRHPGDIGHNFMHSMGWTTKENPQTLNAEKEQPKISPAKVNQSTQYHKNEKLVSPPEKVFNQCCTNCTCQCSRPAKCEYFPSQVKLGPNNKRSEGQTQAGPSKKLKQNVSTEKRSPYLSTIPTRDDDCGVELAPLLARRWAQQRPVTLSTTDVTKFKAYNPNMDHPCWYKQRIELLDELSRQVKHKQHRTEKCRQRDIESSQQHFDTWQGLWGRPGHGAPMNNIKIKRNNLNDILYLCHEV